MVIGIDLGTTISVAAYVDKNGLPQVIPNRDGTNTMPSVVLFDHGEVTVGIQAKNNVVTSPLNVAQFAKRHIGTNYEFYIDDDDNNELTYTPEDISAFILSRIKSDCEDFLGQKVTGAVITVPAYFTDAQKNSTIAAGRIADLNVLKIIHEPTAAAVAYSLNTEGSCSRILIYDLGGGTFDVTAAEIKGKEIAVLASHGFRNLGGFDFDNQLMEYAAKVILDETGTDINDDLEDLQLLRQRCEEAKIALSTRKNYAFTMNLRGKKAKVEINREIFESLIMPIIETTGDSISIVLEEGNIQAGEIDKVLLVGGSSIIPAISEYIRKKIGINPSAEVNPHEVVAIGAAICANSIGNSQLIEKNDEPDVNVENQLITKINAAAGDTNVVAKKESYSLIDRNAHGFGVIVKEGDINVNSIIIPRNQPLSKTFTKVYSSSYDNQTEINIQVTEGEDHDLNYVSKIGESVLELIPHPKGSPIAVEFMYDENGIISGRIFDLFDASYECDNDNYLIGTVDSLDNSVFIGNVIIKREFALSEEEIETKKQFLGSLTIQ